MFQEEEKKKVLFIITKSVWGGAQKYVYDLAVNLPKDKFETAVAAGPSSSNHGETSGQGKLAEEIKKAGVAFYEIKNFKRDISFISDILAFFEILKLLKNFKPDIVHVNSSKAGGIAGLSFRLSESRKSKIKVFTAHGWAFNEARPKWQIFLIKLASRITCRFYDKIICVSEFDRQAAIKNKIAAERKLVIIHNGININEGVFFDKEKAKENLKFKNENLKTTFKNLNLENQILIGTVGEFTRNKGHKFLIEAISKIRNSKLDIWCLIIGWGEDKQKLEAKIKELGLEDKIFLVEGVSPVIQYLKAFDIFVLSSLKEGLPYTLLEAGLAGLPAIATDIGGIPEIIENKKTGLLIKPADVGMLVSAIQKLMEDKNLAEKLSGNLHKKIISEFSLGKMVTETLEVYL